MKFRSDIDYYLGQITKLRKAEDLIEQIEYDLGKTLKSFEYSLIGYGETDYDLHFHLWESNPELAKSIKKVLKIKKWEKDVTTSYHTITGVGKYLKDEWSITIKKNLPKTCVIDYEKKKSEEIDLATDDNYIVKDGKLTIFKEEVKSIKCPDDYNVTEEFFGGTENV